MKITFTLFTLAIIALGAVWLNSVIRARTLKARWEICMKQAGQIVAGVKSQYPGCEGAVMEDKTPANAKDLKVVRDLFGSIGKQLCSGADNLSEPLKGMFLGIKKQFDEKLAGLPPTEQVPAALDLNYQLNSLHWCLQGVDQMIQILNQQLSGTSAQMASLVAGEIEKQIKEGTLIKKEDVAIQITTAIETQVKAGDLITKDLSTQLCSQAETNGITKGETNLRNQLAAQAEAAKKIGERKATLQTAGVTILDSDVEKILGGTDDEFKTRQKRYDTRLVELTGKGFSLNSPDLLSNLWKEDAEYSAFVNVISAIPSMKGQGEPFAGGHKPNTSSSGNKPMLV